MKAQIHQRSTGADFQVKKEGAGAGTSKAASEKKVKREEDVHYGLRQDTHLLMKKSTMS